jgi:hypothetical protein
MPDGPPQPTADDVGAEASPEQAPGTPRWVKIFGAIAVAVIVLFVVLLLIGGHGPGRHTKSNADDEAAATRVL